MIIFWYPTNIIWPTKLSSITIFYVTPSQQPQTQTQTQTSNPNENSITNEDSIIRFHEANMDDFSEHKDQELFHHNNDQSDDEGVAVTTSPLLQYHQPRCPVELNLDHLPQYIDYHHFVQQQDYVQPSTDALEVGMTIDEKAQYIQTVKEYNIRNHVDYKTIYFDQRKLNFVCKSHENGCTWSLAHAIQRSIRNELSIVLEVIILVSHQCSNRIIGNLTNAL